MGQSKDRFAERKEGLRRGDRISWGRDPRLGAIHSGGALHGSSSNVVKKVDAREKVGGEGGGGGGAGPDPDPEAVQNGRVYSDL